MLIPQAVVTTGLPTFADYTPVLTASSVNPTLGSGSTQVGRYMTLGKYVWCTFQITFGTSGVSAGSGTYYISIPVNFGASLPAYVQLGVAFLYQTSSATMRAGLIQRDNLNNRCYMFVENSTGAASDAAPWVWAANNQINGFFSYESV